MNLNIIIIFVNLSKKKIIKFAVRLLYKYPDIVATNSIESTADLSKFIKEKFIHFKTHVLKKLLKKNL